MIIYFCFFFFIFDKLITGGKLSSKSKYFEDLSIYIFDKYGLDHFKYMILK